VHKILRRLSNNDNDGYSREKRMVGKGKDGFLHRKRIHHHTIHTNNTSKTKTCYPLARASDRNPASKLCDDRQSEKKRRF
jgi:hypothetical protein